MRSFPKGATIVATASFLRAGVLTDPSVITARTESPTGTQTGYTYGVDSQLTQPDDDQEVPEPRTGVFQLTFIANESGVWSIKFTGTVTAAGVEEIKFRVRESEF